jgi:hypothetical protein
VDLNIVEDVSKISTNKLRTFDVFNFYFTSGFRKVDGILYVRV